MAQVNDVYKDPEVIKYMKQTYDLNASQDERNNQVEIISAKIGKSKVSVRAKLSALGHYKAQQRVSKDGNKIVNKSELVDNINEKYNLNLTEAEADSLEKATKTTLRKILNIQEDAE
jgi:hypothetical protein